MRAGIGGVVALVMAMAMGAGLVAAPAARAQEATAGAAAPDTASPAVPDTGIPAAQPASPAAKTAKAPPRDPNIGAVTQLPLPRYVSLKTNEGNARRGPGLTHRIDWVFTLAGMPLRVTAEYENWRRVEDADGAGGWVHYSLLSSARAALVTQDMAEFLVQPEDGAAVVFQAEYGVVGRLLECDRDWCRLSVDGEKGWARKAAIWGVEPEERVE